MGIKFIMAELWNVTILTKCLPESPQLEGLRYEDSMFCGCRRMRRIISLEMLRQHLPKPAASLPSSKINQS